MASLLAELYTYHVTRVIATRVCARERITLSAMVYSSSSILGWWCKAGKGWSLTRCRLFFFFFLLLAAASHCAGEQQPMCVGERQG